MNKKAIYLITAFAVFVAVFFQLSRMNVFIEWQNLRNPWSTASHTWQGEPVEDMAADHFLIVYDPEDVGSVFARHHIEQMLKEQKKTSESYAFDQAIDEIPPGTRGVLIAMGDLGSLVSRETIERYVENGGTVAQLIRPDAKREPLPQDFLEAMGIESAGEMYRPIGIDIHTDYLLGGKGFHFGEGTSYTTNSTEVELSEDVTVHITAASQEPLLWERREGAGKYIVYNGEVRDDKTNTGVLAAIFSHCGTDTLYPVLNAKLFFIDDFPSPSPKGVQEKIDREFGMTTADFYRQIWWPFMQKASKDYNMLYTGLIIESYDDQVTPPFHATLDRQGRDNLIVYGRELLDMGGELGLHGYNHQSLAPAGYGQSKLEYIPWNSKEDMVASLQELRRYVYEAYPDYTFQVYVPPSDILSPEGHEAVKEVFPELKVYCSLFDGLYEDRAYYQDFRRNANGTYEIPRLSSGYEPSGIEMWQDIGGLNYLGIFSHFVHPDEIFFEETGDKGWGELSAGFQRYMQEICDRYGWLRACTASQCADTLGDLIDMDYRVSRDRDGMTIACWNYQQPVHFILRTDQAIDMDGTRGCHLRALDGNAYLVELTDSRARIAWQNQQK